MRPGFAVSRDYYSLKRDNIRMTKNYLTEVDDLILRLDEDQLRAINRKVVARIKLIHRAKSTVAMSRFNIGDRVYFFDNGRKNLGRVVRLNQRTTTVQMDDGHQWLIAPALLVRVIEQ